jgi:hypothetical protein
LRATHSIVVLTAAALYYAASGGATAEQGALSIELNKLEPQDGGCRAYLVVTNKKQGVYKSLKLDLVLFQPDGIINKRFALEIGPLKAGKRTVKLFDIEATPCEQVGSVLLNDVLACEIEPAETADCLDEIATSSLTKAELTK